MIDMLSVVKIFVDVRSDTNSIVRRWFFPIDLLIWQDIIKERSFDLETNNAINRLADILEGCDIKGLNQLHLLVKNRSYRPVRTIPSSRFPRCSRYATRLQRLEALLHGTKTVQIFTLISQRVAPATHFDEIFPIIGCHFIWLQLAHDTRYMLKAFQVVVHGGGRDNVFGDTKAFNGVVSCFNN